MDNKILIPKSRYTKALLPISDSTTYFKNEQFVRDYLTEVANKFEEVNLVIAGTLKRHNEMTLENITEEEAINKLNISTIQYKNFIRDRIKEIDPNKDSDKDSNKFSDKFNIYSWQEMIDFSGRESFENNLKILSEEFAKGERFTEDISRMTENFLLLGNNPSKLKANGVSLEDAIKKNSQYLIEESAGLLSIPCAFDKITEIYPGTFGIQEDLQKGKYGFESKLNISNKRNFREAKEYSFGEASLKDATQILTIGTDKSEFGISKYFWDQKQLENLITSDQDFVIVAKEKENEEIKGFAICSYHPPTGKATFENAWVSKDDIKYGISSHLKKYVENFCSEIGAKFIVSMTEKSDSLAKRCLEKSGYKTAGVFNWNYKNL